MISILIVDDSTSKSEKIVAAIYQILEPPDVAIDRAFDAHDAGRRMLLNTYDLLVLDLFVPLRAGEEARRDGGVLLLRQMSRQREWKTPRHILGLTAYQDLAAESEPAFKRDLLHVVSYREDSTEWIDALGRQLLHILQERSPPERGHGCDLAIVTALHRVELESVLDLPAEWTQASAPGDHAIYHRGTFKRGERSLAVVAGACSEMGMPAAAAHAMKVIEAFRPRFIAMTGIAAGTEGAFGDVLVADQSWDYGSGKRKSTESGTSVFLPAPSYIPIDQVLRAQLNFFVLDRSVLRGIRERWPGAKPTGELAVKMGPLASGAAVLQSRDAVDEISSHNRKVVGVEMETYGVFMAARECREPRPRAMSFKSICDFGDSNKGDDYQRYAAYTSAQFLYEFALQHLAP